MTKKEYIKQYKELAIKAYNKYIKVIYERDENMIHTYYGRILKLRKDSFILLLNDELKVDIGFRNIKDFKIL